MAEAGPAPGAFDRGALGALLSYLALSVLFFGRGLVGNFSTYHMGTGPDSVQSVWFLAWWAYAISHRINPLLPKVVFFPVGINLTWATDVPLLALLATPLTLTAGPVATYNALMLGAPALAAWAAFVLCRHLAGEWLPGWLGGFVFGFSPYMVGGMLGHLHVVMVFPIPLCVWLALRRLGGEIGRRAFVAAMALLLAVQFGCFVETFATSAMLGTIALALALLFTADELRRRIWLLIAELAAVYAIGAALMAPLLYFMFAHGFPRGVVFSSWNFSSDLLGFIVPTPMNEIGRLSLFAAIAAKFRCYLPESGSYIAAPLFAIAALYARSQWRAPTGRLLVDLLVITCVLTMGPWLQVAGRYTIGLPWWVFESLPLLNKALPGRLEVYLFLLLSIITALWLSAPGAYRGRRWILAATTVPLMLPNLAAGYWITPTDLPSLFSTTAYRRYLAPGEVVLVLPYGWQGDDMLWQASTTMYFNLAGGYTGYAPLLPVEYAQWPIMPAFYYVAGVPDMCQRFRCSM